MDKVILYFIGFVIFFIVIIVSFSVIVTIETKQYVDCLEDIAQEHCGSEFVIEYISAITIPAKHFQCVDNRQLQDTKYIFTDEEVRRCKAT